MKKKLTFVLACLPLVAMAGCSYDIVIDSDRDGTPDEEDSCPNDPGLQTDTGVCGCNLRLVNGKCVYMGLEDTDADGVPDDNDLCPQDPNKVSPGVCGCGQIDDDTDGDGTPDCIDGCPNDNVKTYEGYCGCGNLETDSDSDTIPDCVDECPENEELVKEGVCGCDNTDTDGDKTPDCKDDCKEDPLKVLPGICGCGVSDDLDADKDGFPDCIDDCELDPHKTAPGVCGCHVPDVDSDMDGIMDCQDACPNDPLKSENSGSCGCNVKDLDENQNGIYDCHETCISSTVGKTEYGYCGCTVEDTDTDGDTLPDCVDLCPEDPAKVAPMICGCGQEELDSDLDGVLDCKDACPMDHAKSENEGICGCNPDLQYDEKYDDTLDSDHDGTLDCIDECPYDSTRQKILGCECGSAGVDQEISGKWVCVEKGGVIQADYTLFHAFGTLPENSHKALSQAYNKRKIGAPVIRLTYLPGGNLLENPAMEYDTDGWTVSSSYAILYNTGRYAEKVISRPFGKYPLYWGGLSRTTFSQTVRLPEFSTSQTVTAGMFAFSQTFGGQTADPINVTIQHPGGSVSLSNQVADVSAFRFHSRQVTLDPSSSNQNVTFKFMTGDSSSWAGHYGAQVQYMAAWIGDREIRFSNDGKTWTEWQKFQPSANGTSEVWHREDWNLIDAYGGNNEPGPKTVYMQTHDLLNDKYYQATDTFEFVIPKEDGKLFIGESPIASQGFTSKEDVTNACTTRTLSSPQADIYFVPGGNLLQNADLLDVENEATSAEPWTMTDASVLWRSETGDESSRHIPSTPVISLNESESSLSQDIVVPENTPNTYLGMVFSSTTNSESPEISITSYKAGEPVDQFAMPLSTASGTKLTRLYPRDEAEGKDTTPLSEGIDKIHFEIKNPESDAAGITRLDSLYFTLGRTFVRFSFDNKQSWTHWLNVNVTNWYQHPDDEGIMNDINHKLMYPNATLVSKDHKTTVYMQTLNLDTYSFYETSETVETSF